MGISKYYWDVNPLNAIKRNPSYVCINLIKYYNDADKRQIKDAQAENKVVCLAI